MKLNFNESILHLERFEIIDSWRGSYTLGILSKPIWMTVSSQQMRAANLAKEFTDTINKNIKTLPKKNSRINVAIIGAGIGGLTLAHCLQAYRNSNQDFTISIDIFEKHDVLCPIQRGCHTRRLHPNIQYWPEKYEDEFTIDYLKGNDLHNSLSWTGGLSAAEVATKVSEIFFKNFDSINKKTTKNNSITIYQGCNYLKVDKISRNYQISFSGHEILDSIGNTELSIGVKNNYDAIFFCTGFGIETEYKDKDFEVPSKKYWRNDSLGQPNLNGEPHRYLISGNGDGAVSDTLRALLIDYKPEKLLSQLTNSNIEYLVNASHNIKTTINESNKEILQSKLESLIKQKEDSKKFPEIVPKNSKETLNNFNKKWHDTDWKIKSKSPFKLLSEILIWPRIKNNTEVICHFKNSSNLSELINNPFVTFYNKFFFYSLWAAGKIKITTGDIKSLSEKFDIKKENILIRHGANYELPIKSIISENLIRKFEYCLKRRDEQLSSINKKFQDYREGRYIHEIQEPSVRFNPRKLKKIYIKNKNTLTKKQRAYFRNSR